MSDRMLPWYGLHGHRRVLVRVLTLMVVVSGVWFATLLSVVTAAVALPAGGFGILQPFAMDPVTATAVAYFGLWLLFGLAALIVTLVAWKGMKMSHRAIAAVITVSLWGIVILGAAGMNPAGPVTGGQPTANALQMTITPSVQTTDVIASPYTAVTSQTPLTSDGSGTTAGYMWAAISSGTGAQYNAQSPLSGQFIDQTGDQVAVSGKGGKLSANAGTSWQMKFVFSYTNAPPASGGGSVYFPVFVYLTGVSYSAPVSNLNNQPFNQQYNNGTAKNNPIFPTSLVGGGAFPVLVKDAAATQREVCPNLENANLQFQGSLPSCSGMNVNQNPTSNSITFYIMVSTGAAGLFGWATTDAGVGSSLTMTFQIGLPSAQALPGYGSYYTPTLAQYTLTIQRTAA